MIDRLIRLLGPFYRTRYGQWNLRTFEALAGTIRRVAGRR